MRDFIVQFVLYAACAVALRHAWVGVLLWTNISLMSPHVEFGYAASASAPVGLVCAICTVVGLVMTRDKQNPIIGAPSVWLLLFTIWISVTVPMSRHYEPSFDLWVRSIKIFVMLFVTMALVTDRRKLELLIWVIVGSLGFYGVKGGLFTLATAGNYRVWGPGGFIAGNNELALAVVTVVPLMRYLQMQLTRPLYIRTMGVAMLLMCVTAMGSQSRGALLALTGMGLYMWAKSDRKAVFAVAVVVVAVFALSFMPQEWWNRMNTIKTYEEDASAMGRINAWIMAWNLAKDSIWGGGFLVSTPELFAIYSPQATQALEAHSIYFQVMGTHGFIGLGLYLGIGVSTWMCCRQLIAFSRIHPDLKWPGQLGAMLQVAMVGYGVGGAFLSLAFFDLPFDLMAIAVLGRRIAERQLARPVPVTEPVPPLAPAAGR